MTDDYQPTRDESGIFGNWKDAEKFAIALSVCQKQEL